MTQGLFSPAPIYPALEETTLAFSLSKLHENLGADDPLVQKVLGKESPEDLARSLVQGTKLADVSLRQQLWKNGTAGSDDPMIQLAQRIDPEARALRKTYEDKIESTLKKNSELVAKARFATQGTSTYPDATFTLRLSYGSVQGYQEGARFSP